MRKIQNIIFIFYLKDLSNQVEHIQQKLALQITNDFQNAFTNSHKNNANCQQGDKLSLAQLTDACLVVSVLEDSKIKIDLLKWFICKWTNEILLICPLYT